MTYFSDRFDARKTGPTGSGSSVLPWTSAWVPVMALAAGMVTLPGCAGYGPGPLRVGDTEPAVITTMGAPTTRHRLASGQSRLVYARGPMGKHTWMVDLAADGRVASIRQVLVEPELAAIEPGRPAEAMLLEFGPPAERRAGGLAGGEVWSYRYANYDCRWFQVSIGDDRRVTSGSFGNDPACEPYYDS